MAIIPPLQLSLPLDEFRSKRCTKCDEEKTLTEFHKQQSLPDGHKCYCKVCCKKINAERHNLNRETYNEGARARYAANPESYKQRMKLRYETDPEQRKNYVKEWQRQHPDRAKAYKRKWDKENLAVKREHTRRRYARRKGAATVHFTKAQLDQKKNYWGYRCWVCGRPSDSVDHVKPLAKGGAHMLCNLRPICRLCNSSKNDRWPYPLT